MASIVNPSGIQDIDGILWGWRWDTGNLTYSFPTSAASYAGYAAINGFQAFNSAQQQAVGSVLGNVASFASLTFTRVEGPTKPFLRFAEADSISYTSSSFHVVDTAEAHPPDPVFPDFSHGDSWFNHVNYNNPAPGNYAFATVMHEIGHALGLKHGHAAQTAHGISFPTLPPDHDSFEYSIMTYSQFPGDSDPVDNALEHPTTYMQDDIAALQYIYGASYNHLVGNTTYWWEPTNGQQFIDGVGQGIPISNFILMTVWDGGGVDTYLFSNYSIDLTVNLNPGAWTTTSADQLADLGNNGAGGPEYFARGNIANALLFGGNTASLIENAVGGLGNDQIIGNQADNVLRGYVGNDRLWGGLGTDYLDGGSGLDTAVIHDWLGNSLVHLTGSGAGTLISSEGIDALLDLERVQFNDAILALDIEGNAGQAYRLYQAAFDRVPDKVGLGYWISELDGGKTSLSGVALSFIGSEEFHQTYGDPGTVTDVEFVTLLYANVLDRAPDEAGLEYWLDDLSSGYARELALLSFSESAENKANVIGAIDDGINYTPWLA